MSVITWERVGTVAKMVMNNGENRHNPTFVKAILDVFDEIEADPQVNAVVLASSDAKNWSQGIDLPWMLGAVGDPARHQEVKDFMYGLNDIFRRILLYPVPVIAAINGHAFGDGSIMACACDFRLMRSDRGYFCFPEVDVNIPFMPGMMAVVKRAIPYYKLEEMYYTGKRCTGAELAESHVVIKACPDLESLEKDAMDFAATFSKDRKTFAEMKKRAHREIVRVLDEDDPPIIDTLSMLG